MEVMHVVHQFEALGFEAQPLVPGSGVIVGTKRPLDRPPLYLTYQDDQRAIALHVELELGEFANQAEVQRIEIIVARTGDGTASVSVKGRIEYPADVAAIFPQLVAVLDGLKCLRGGQS